MKRFLVLLLVFSASAAYGEMYTWKDAKGTVFYTNSIHDIPARYLKKARVLDVATGKKGGLATEQPGQNAAQQAQPVMAVPGAAVTTPPPPAPVPTVANPSPPAAPAASMPRPQSPPPRSMRSRRRVPRQPGGSREE